MEEIVIDPQHAHKDQLKQLLTAQLEECKEIIRKRKRKIKLIKITFYSLIAVSTIGSSTVILLSSFLAPSIVISVLSTIVTLSTILSVKFNLEGRMQKLGESIQTLNGIKHKLSYVTACNGNLTETEYKMILENLQNVY